MAVVDNIDVAFTPSSTTIRLDFSNFRKPYRYQRRFYFYRDGTLIATQMSEKNIDSFDYTYTGLSSQTSYTIRVVVNGREGSGVESEVTQLDYTQVITTKAGDNTVTIYPRSEAAYIEITNIHTPYHYTRTADFYIGGVLQQSETIAADAESYHTTISGLQSLTEYTARVVITGNESPAVIQTDYSETFTTKAGDNIVTCYATSSAIHYKISCLHSPYNYRRRFDFYLDGSLLLTKYSAIDIESYSYTYTGLLPETRHSVRIVVTGQDSTYPVHSDYSATFTLPVPSISKWKWNASNGTATTAETTNAYSAVAMQGAVSSFKYKVWNDLVSKAEEALIAQNFDWVTTYGTASETRLSSTNKTLTAKKFNSLLTNIRYPWFSWHRDPSSRGYTGRLTFSRGEYVYGKYFLQIAEQLNRTIDIFNKTADFNLLEANNSLGDIAHEAELIQKLSEPIAADLTLESLYEDAEINTPSSSPVSTGISAALTHEAEMITDGASELGKYMSLRLGHNAPLIIYQELKVKIDQLLSLINETTIRNVESVRAKVDVTSSLANSLKVSQASSEFLTLDDSSLLTVSSLLRSNEPHSVNINTNLYLTPDAVLGQGDPFGMHLNSQMLLTHMVNLVLDLEEYLYTDSPVTFTGEGTITSDVGANMASVLSLGFGYYPNLDILENIELSSIDAILFESRGALLARQLAKFAGVQAITHSSNATAKSDQSAKMASVSSVVCGSESTASSGLAVEETGNASMSIGTISTAKSNPGSNVASNTSFSMSGFATGKACQSGSASSEVEVTISSVNTLNCSNSLYATANQTTTIGFVSNFKRSEPKHLGSYGTGMEFSNYSTPVLKPPTHLYTNSQIEFENEALVNLKVPMNLQTNISVNYNTFSDLESIQPIELPRIDITSALSINAGLETETAWIYPERIGTDKLYIAQAYSVIQNGNTITIDI